MGRGTEGRELEMLKKVFGHFVKQVAGGVRKNKDCNCPKQWRASSSNWWVIMRYIKVSTFKLLFQLGISLEILLDLFLVLLGLNVFLMQRRMEEEEEEFGGFRQRAFV